MLKTILGIALTLPSLSFAQETVRIKDVRAWVVSTGTENTCADQYLARRKQLSKRMALAPLTLVGGIAAGALSGGALGHGTFVALRIPNDGWTDLGYTLGGAMLGSALGVGITVTGTTISTVNFFKNQRLLKIIVESRTNLGAEMKALHLKYNQQYPEDALAIEDFSDRIAELDLTGKLCDGSIVAPKRFKKGRKLKQMLATQKEIFAFIHE